MKRLVIHRFRESATENLSTLYLGDKKLVTLERPWIPDAPGGTPNVSCVPAGVYQLVRHTRPKSGDKVLALVNAGLGVYYMPDDRPQKVGRWGILFHAATYVSHLEGCIAPGFRHAHNEKGAYVTESGAAMELIMRYVGDDDAECEILGETTYREAA